MHVPNNLYVNIQSQSNNIKLFVINSIVYLHEREREREVILSSLEVKYEKILNFTWYVWKWVVTLDVQELYQLMFQSREIRHCGSERNLCKDWAWLKMCGEHCIIVWYSNSRTCLGQSVHSRTLSSLVPQRPVSHRSACELSRMEALVRTVDNGMGSNMYRFVRFPHSTKNMVL